MLEIGEIITVEIYTKRGDRQEKDRQKNRTGEVIAINDKHFTIKYKNYTETFLLADMGKAYKIVGEEKPKEAEIMPETAAEYLEKPKNQLDQAMEILSKEKMEELLKAGKTDKEIMAEFNLKQNQIARLIRRYNLAGMRGNGLVGRRARKEQPADEEGAEIKAAEDETLVEYPEHTLTEIEFSQEDIEREFNLPIGLLEKTQASDEEFNQTFEALLQIPESELHVAQKDVKEKFLQTVNLEPISGDTPEPEQEIDLLRRRIANLEFETELQIDVLEKTLLQTIDELKTEVKELRKFIENHQHQYGMFTGRAVV